MNEKVQGVQEKLCLSQFTATLAYIAVRDLLSSQRNASNFCTPNSSRVLARESWQTFENSCLKTQYLMNTL